MADPTPIREPTLEELLERNTDLQRRISELAAQLERIRGTLIRIKQRCDTALEDTAHD